MFINEFLLSRKLQKIKKKRKERQQKHFPEIIILFLKMFSPRRSSIFTRSIYIFSIFSSHHRITSAILVKLVKWKIVLEKPREKKIL